MPKTCKIEQLGLVKTVQSLRAEEISTRAAMMERLRANYGADFSPTTVDWFMAKLLDALGAMVSTFCFARVSHNEWSVCWKYDSYPSLMAEEMSLIVYESHVNAQFGILS